MKSSVELVRMFFHDLKQFNATNFKSIETADLSVSNPSVHKAFSSAITRYFIFREKHTEISEAEHNMLFYKLKLDLIARYFSEYPDTTPENLVAFQLELINYVKETKGEQDDELAIEV